MKLQEIVSHQGEDISRLNEELYTQQEEIAELRKQLKRLQTKFETVEEGNSDIGSIDQEAPPPHY